MTNLNSAQQRAVESDSSLILGLAGPGSGKTKTLVARISRLLAQGVDPRTICCITFTNAAARELQDRISREWVSATATVELDPVRFEMRDMITCKTVPTQLAYCGTLHGLCFRLLQKYAILIGLPDCLTILDAEAATDLMDDCARTMKAKGSEKLITKLRETWYQWSATAKNWTADQLAVKEYYSRLAESGAIDFDSILALGLRLINKLNADRVLVGYDWLFVDEYQDSSSVDSFIYSALRCANKFFVGDPDQSIFSFRGADINNIMAMSNMPGCERITLDLNYRSGRRICSAANKLISHNLQRVEKDIRPARPEPGDVEFHSFEQADSELAFVLQDLRKNLNESNYKDFALLFRTNALVNKAVDYFKNHGVPVAERRPDVPLGDMTARAALAVMINPYNDLTALRLINLLGGPALVAKARTTACATLSSVGSCIFDQLPKFGNNGEMNLADFQNLVSWLVDSCHTNLKCEVPTATIKRLVDCAATAPGRFSLGDLLVSLNQHEPAELGSGVTITTYHGSKGREFPTVYVSGCEQETTPGQRKDVNLEEERRLFFVAITRAMNRLVLTNSTGRQNRFRPWETERLTISQFVGEAMSIAEIV